LATQLLVAKHTFLGYGIIMQGQHFTLLQSRHRSVCYMEYVVAREPKMRPRYLSVPPRHSCLISLISVQRCKSLMPRCVSHSVTVCVPIGAVMSVVLHVFSLF